MSESSTEEHAALDKIIEDEASEEPQSRVRPRRLLVSPMPVVHPLVEVPVLSTVVAPVVAPLLLAVPSLIPVPVDIPNVDMERAAQPPGPVLHLVITLLPATVLDTLDRPRRVHPDVSASLLRVVSRIPLAMFPLHTPRTQWLSEKLPPLVSPPTSDISLLTLVPLLLPRARLPPSVKLVHVAQDRTQPRVEISRKLV